MTVTFSVEEGLDASYDEQRLSSLVSSILGRELREVSEYLLEVHFVGDHTIRVLNASHRSRDAATDVLSFPLLSPDFVVPQGEPLHLGDVVISFPRAKEQAVEYGHSVEREVAYLLAHGVLHLLGYDHEAPSDQALMRQKEEEALQPLGFTR